MDQLVVLPALVGRGLTRSSHTFVFVVDLQRLIRTGSIKRKILQARPRWQGGWPSRTDQTLVKGLLPKIEE